MSVATSPIMIKKKDIFVLEHVYSKFVKPPKTTNNKPRNEKENKVRHHIKSHLKD